MRAAGISTFPLELGSLASLEALQLEGCPLEGELGRVYEHTPLALVALHCQRTRELVLAHMGLQQVGGAAGRPTDRLPAGAALLRRQRRPRGWPRCACRRFRSSWLR
jgi:hypothetical protein